MEALKVDAGLTKAQGKAGRKVLLLGVFPPPVHGAAVVNTSVRDILCRRRSVQVFTLNLAAGSANRSTVTRLQRVGKVIWAFVEFIRLCVRVRPDSLYLGASGGFGQFYDAVFSLTARLFHLSIVIHHHSCRYVDSVRAEFRLLTWAAGPSAMHIALCPGMLAELRDKYRGVVNAAVVSNAAWIPLAPDVVIRTKLEKIGYFGNVSMEKGIAEFLDIAKTLSRSRLQFVVGGRFHDKETEDYFAERVRECGNVSYLGAKYGKEKDAFFKGIDLLIFPSKYAHEAEPLTVWEALSHGVPVIASQRGCMKSMVPDTVGCILEINSAFVANVCRKIEEWQHCPDAVERMSCTAPAYFGRIKRESEDQAERLITYLGGMA